MNGAKPGGTGNAADEQDSLHDFYRRMAEQGMPVRPPTAGPGWTPPEPLDIPADELSAELIRLRRRGL